MSQECRNVPTLHKSQPELVLVFCLFAISCRLPSAPLPSVPLPSAPLPSAPLPSAPLPSSPLPSAPLPSAPLPRASHSALISAFLWSLLTIICTVAVMWRGGSSTQDPISRCASVWWEPISVCAVWWGFENICRALPPGRIGEASVTSSPRLEENHCAIVCVCVCVCILQMNVRGQKPFHSAVNIHHWCRPLEHEPDPTLPSNHCPTLQCVHSVCWSVCTCVSNWTCVWVLETISNNQ